ncbi:uncharacterized protein LOC126999887 [Eriocheir sinensis]|uniref:uncharacterized protein LOC126999887 n=1 Tax=Eriocheir sinensis TaxID=95602 RepID=UPI0021C8FD64|nr:uncharacterized protein LOC126999887 [Eriocheir sinensis]
MDPSRLILSDYQILHELGTGSYGSAHLALHGPSDTKHVIKKIKISHMTDKEVENARREVQVLSSLSHPYITQFQGSCEEDGFLLIAMDYCAGGDLHSLITKRNGILFPEDRVLDWFVQLCLAVKYVHDRKILHRDIKSQNIFLTDDGKVRLGDFGIAKILNSSSELAKTCIGTPYYLSPEMCENKPYNNKSDVWALGCVLYEMVTLRHAFEANNMKTLILKIIKGAYPPVPPRYSRDLRLLLSQIFQREPQARPSICAVLRKAFIFKRVSKFISGCEEAELKQSLVKRKYQLPASSQRVLAPRRPSDITEPGAKYGVSLNRKLVHKSPSKSVARAAKQAIPGGKKVPKAPPRITERLRKDSRKRCPSEDILSSKDQHQPQAEQSKRYQRRSKSVPHAFKQNNLKPQHQHYKNKTPSPIKVNLMLDSAGLRKGKQGDKISKGFEVGSRFDNEVYALPRSPGWLADEFLTKKVKAVHDKRKHMEAFVSGIAKECAKEPPESEGAVARCVSPCKGASCALEERKPVQNIFPKVNKSHKVYKSEPRPGGEVELPNPKDVKELANQSLKWQGSPRSEDDDHDEEEALLGVSPEKLRQVMHKKMTELLKERTKKMSQMVSERRQWAYEKEKLCNTSMPQNDEGETLKPNDKTCNDTNGKGEIHQNFKRADSLHSTTKYQDATGIPENSYAHESDDWPHEPSTSRSSDKNSLFVMEEVMRSGCEERTFNVVVCQKSMNLSSNTECDESSAQCEKITVGKSFDTEGNVSNDKITQQKIKKDSLAENGIPKLISQGCLNEGKESAASEDLATSHHSTPSMRARWGAVHTADLEKSPLETTASEMDTTGPSDCVFVYRGAGERKQWGKDCDDVISVLSEAQIFEECRKVQSEITEVTKSLTDVETLSDNFLEQQCTPVIMNSTFTLKEGLQECKGANCDCNSKLHSTNTVQKPLVLNDTFQIEKSTFEEERKSIGPPLLNSTFDMKGSCDSFIAPSEAPAMNSTYNIDKKEVVADTIHQGCCEGNPKHTHVIETVLLKESKQSLEGTYAVSSREGENNAQKTDPSLIMGKERTIPDKKVATQEVSTKTKSGLLGKLRLHMSPQVKYKYQNCDNRFKLPKTPLSSKVKGCAISASSESNIPKVTDSSVPTRRGSIKLGLSGILRRFSSRHIMKTPTRSKSEETVEKDLESLADSERVQSDTDSSQQEEVECVTVKFVDGASQNNNQKMTEDTISFETKTNVAFGQDTFDMINNKSTASIRDDDFNDITREMCDKKPEEVCCSRKINEQFVDEGTPSELLPSNIVLSYSNKLDETSTDSGIDSQKTSVCQMSSTDCSNSQVLRSGSLELQSESGGSELQKAHKGDPDWLLVSNSLEVTGSSGFIGPQGKQESSTQNLTSTCAQTSEVTQTILLDGNSKDNLQDISPVSTSGIHIKLMTSTQQKDERVQSECENDCLDCNQVEQTEHKTLITAKTNRKQKTEAKQDSQTMEIKITLNDEVPRSPRSLEGSSQSLAEQPVIPCSPARARPTVLDIGVKTTDLLQGSHSTSRDDRSRGRKSNISRATNGKKTQQQPHSGSQESVAAASQSRACGSVCAGPTGNPSNVNPQATELFSSSDEESEDLANLRQSMAILLNYEGNRREENQKQLPELWHLDRDGGVVPGGGGVYCWIEEQRARLEDELSLEVFIKAYHLLEEAQEREGCVVGESVSQVECLLGPDQRHLAYDILQLVVAEAVYHD